MLERAAALRRQWGLRWRKVGVFVRRAADADEDASALGGPVRPGGSAGARRHCRDRPAACARRLTRTRGGSRMTWACFWCCVRRRERERGAAQDRPMTSDAGRAHEREDLLGRGPGPAAVHRRGRALGRRARRQADGGAERAPARPRALRRRRRRADGGAGPRLAVPHRGRGGDGGGRDPGAAAQAPAPASTAPSPPRLPPSPMRSSSSTAPSSRTRSPSACAGAAPRSPSSTTCRRACGPGGPAGRARCAAMWITCWRCCRSSRTRICASAARPAPTSAIR